MRLHHGIAATILIFAAACDAPTSPSDTAFRLGASAPASAGARSIGVMTQNLFVGADVDAVLLALVSPDPDDDFQALLSAIQTLQRTDFPSRAAALVEQIERTRPHVVGLQEVSEIDIVVPPLSLDLHLDFLPILEAALAARGLNYVVAAQVQNIDATPAPGIRLVDYDVLLVDADRVTVNSASGQNFDLNLGPFAPGVTILRGWVVARTTIDGRNYTFVSTHPEPDLGSYSFAELRAAQLGEIVTALGNEAPAILMGDLNDDPGSLMYQVLEGAGFTDVWKALHPGAEGLTCCHETDLSDRVPQFDQRRDYVFVRGLAHQNREVMGQITRFGMLPSDLIQTTLGTIWVSDHAGVLAELLLPPAVGHTR